MKHIISVSIDRSTVEKIQEILRKSSFRNKSHIVEEAIKQMHKDKENSNFIEEKIK